MMGRRDDPTLVGGVPDLDKLRDRGEATEERVPLSGSGPTFWANDVQPSVETDGSIVLVFRNLSSEGLDEPIKVALSAELLASLASILPRLLEAAVERQANSAKRLYAFLAKGAQAKAAVEEHRSGTATPIDQGRRG